MILKFLNFFGIITLRFKFQMFSLNSRLYRDGICQVITEDNFIDV